MLLKAIRNHVDPTTGEVFCNEELEDSDVRDAIIDLVFLSGLSPNIKKNNSVNEFNRPAKRIFEELRVWRLGVAQQLALPPYCVFTDAELRSIAEGDVVCKQDLLRIKGISFTRYDLYGDDIYHILKPYIESDIIHSCNADRLPTQECDTITEEESSLEIQSDYQPDSTDGFSNELPPTKDTQPIETAYNEEVDADAIAEETIKAIEKSLRVKENCQHSKGERCPEVRPNCRTCKDFLILPEILEEERKNWPQIGYATWIRMFGTH